MWNKQSYKIKEYSRTKKLGRNLIQKRDDEDCQCIFESPQFKHDVPLPVGCRIFTQREWRAQDCSSSWSLVFLVSLQRKGISFQPFYIASS